MATSVAAAKTAENYSILPLALKGETDVQWSPPDIEPNGDVFRIVLTGKTVPGTAVLLSNQRPVLADSNGDFKVTGDVKKLEVAVKIHFIATGGEVSTYLVRLLDTSTKRASEIGGETRFKIREDFTEPLYFDLEGNGARALQPRFEYKVSPNDVTVGNFVVSSGTLTFRVVKKDNIRYAIEFYWPRVMAQTGAIEIRDALNKAIWRERIDVDRLAFVDANGIELTPAELEGDPESKVPGSENEDMIRYTSRSMARADIEFLRGSENFRFCFISRQSGFKTQLCSRRLMARAGTWFLRMIPSSKRGEVKAFVNGVEVPPTGMALFEKNKRMQFRALLPSGAELEIETSPLPVYLRDIVLTEDRKHVWIAGTEPAPAGVDYEPHPLGWKALLDLEDMHLYFNGEGGVPFRLDFEIGKPLPMEKHRAFFHKNTPKTTYSKVLTREGQIRDDFKVNSTEEAAINEEGNAVEWDYLNGDRGTFSNSHLLIQDGERQYSSYTEVYRGFPIELSTRLTGIATITGGLWLLGEVAGGIWMDNLFGWRNYYLTDRRWGVTGRSFRSVLAIENRLFNATNAEIKYRLNPGLWNVDETVGLVAGYQAVEYQGSSLPATPAVMYGAGMLWARSMPRIFDEIFNLIPLFRYPKYVDMQGIYYFQSADPRVFLEAGNFNMEFHGKMYFTPKYFVEASFGLRRLAYTNRIVNRAVEVTLLFGSGGLGINF